MLMVTRCPYQQKIAKVGDGDMDEPLRLAELGDDSA